MELIKVYQGNLVSARELYAFFESRERFSRWFTRMKEYGFTEGVDYFEHATKADNNRAITDYLLKLNTAKEISMLQRSEKGQKARQYFIQCEEALKKITDNKRLEAFLKLEATKEKLKQWILDVGLDESKYFTIDQSGNITLFGEYVPDNELGLLGTKGRDFATEVTNELVRKNDITAFEEMKKLNINNHEQIKDMLKDSGIDTTKLKREKPIKKLDK